MKKLRNNKGVTGIDVALSITIIVIVLGVVLSVYSNYSNRTKQVNRNAKATNLAVKVIESIEADDDFEFDTYEIKEEIPKGYTIDLLETSTGDSTLDVVASKIIVTVDYTVSDKTENVSLSTIKYKWNKEAQEPNLNDTRIDGCVPIKYDAEKNAYVKTTFTDPDWYNVSDKRFAKVANTDVIDENGIVNLELCDNLTSVQVWIPGGVLDNGKIRYVDKLSETTCNIIYYITDEEKNISYYKKNDSISTFEKVFGENWYGINLLTNEIDNSSELDWDYTSIYNDYYKFRPFTWKEPEE